MINVALPKGRLGNQVYELFSRIGYECPEFKKDNRKLVFENRERGVRYLLIKPSDVGIYVEHGAADLGVVGKDVLLETEPDVLELLDLKIGKCALAIAGKTGYIEDVGSVLRVATKYPNITKRYFSAVNRQVEIIKLNGSIELAPILGLGDVIVDIVETGTTLKENNLSVIRRIEPVSARLIANQAAYRFKTEEIDFILNKLSEGLCDDENL